MPQTAQLHFGRKARPASRPVEARPSASRPAGAALAVWAASGAATFGLAVEIARLGLDRAACCSG